MAKVCKKAGGRVGVLHTSEQGQAQGSKARAFIREGLLVTDIRGHYSGPSLESERRFLVGSGRVHL